MLKRFVGTRTLDVSDIPAYMNEAGLLSGGFTLVKASRRKETTRLKGIYQYCYVMKPPPKRASTSPIT